MFGKLGEQMRRKLNQNGLIGTLAAIGIGIVAAGTIGKIIVNGASSSILGLLRQIAIWLDTLVFTIASWAYGIFYELSASSLLSRLNLASASQRLYTLLGIFMLFRLAFSFVKYIVNPDDMEKGTSKFITNLAVSLALIVSVPWIFNRAFQLQTYIMESNVIGNLILGMDTNRSDEDTFNASSYGQSIAFMVFNAFYRPNTSISGLESCSNLLVYYNDYVVPESDKTVKVEGLPNGARGDLGKESEKIAACVNALNNTSGDIAYVFGSEENDTEIGTMFYIASQRMDISLLTHPGVFKTYVGDSYVINYTAIVSTIALGFLALLFISFSFDVAIRNVKLCFLQIIAPIPIILNIEPGDTKGDKKSLNWWVRECLRTYVDLFVRVATVYFGVFLINILFTGNTIVGSNNTSAWFKVFMIFGILLFVKQVPEMIGKAFGIDVKGQFNLNPLKRIGDNRLASMVTGGALGFGLGGIGTGIAAYQGARGAGANRGEALRSAITGGVGGAFHSGLTGATKGVKGARDISGNLRENIGRSGRIAGANVGTTMEGRMAARAAMTMGSKTRSQQYDDTVAALEAPGKTLSSIKSVMNGDKTTVSSSVTMGAGTRTFRNAAEADDFLNNNNQLTNADRQLVMNARKAFDQAENLKSSALIANGHRYKDYEEAMSAYANDSNLSMAEKHNLLGELNKRRTAISAANVAQTVTLAGETVSNVKDANDYLERLRNSGAPEWALKDAETQLSTIQAQRWSDAISAANSTGVANVYSLARDEISDCRSRNSQYYDTYVVDNSGTPITNFDNFSNLKAAAGAGNLGAGAVRKQAAQSKRDEEAAKISGPGGRR